MSKKNSKTIGQSVGEGIDSTIDVASSAVESVNNFGTGVSDIAGEAFDGAVDYTGKAIGKGVENVKSFGSDVLDSGSKKIGDGIDTISSTTSDLADGAAKTIGKGIEGAKSLGKGVSDTAVGAYDATKDAVGGFFGKIGDGIKSIHDRGAKINQSSVDKSSSPKINASVEKTGVSKKSEILQTMESDRKNKQNERSSQNSNDHDGLAMI